MPRAMWKGAISFGLVTIPVAVYPATEEKTLRFNQLHDEDMGRIRYKRICEKDGGDRRLRPHREGLRVREGPLRRPHGRRLRRRAGGVHPRHRHRAVRRPRGDRPHAVQEVLLPRPRGDRREGVRAPARGHEPGREGRHREGQLPRQGAPGGAAVPRRRVRPGDDVLARRDPRGGLRRRQRRREGARAGARDGAPADRGPHGGVGSRASSRTSTARR